MMVQSRLIPTSINLVFEGFYSAQSIVTVPYLIRSVDQKKTEKKSGIFLTIFFVRNELQLMIRVRELNVDPLVFGRVQLPRHL